MNVIVSNKYQNLLANLNIDVIKTINGVYSVDDLSVQFRNFFFNKMILDITSIENYEDINTIQKLSLSLDMNKVVLLLDDSPKVNTAAYLSSLVSMGIYNFTKNIDQISFLIDNPNTYKDVASFHQLTMTDAEVKKSMNDFDNNVNNFISQRVIGIKNLTHHAGATTLTYLLKKHLDTLYKVKAAEIDKKDFFYLNDNTLDSIGSNEMKNYISNNNDSEVILFDLNDATTEICTDVIYLIEPGLVQLNRLIREDNRIFEKYRGKKLVLNKSILNSKDVQDFEKESGSKINFNIPSIDDKLSDINVIKEFLLSLGFSRFGEDNKSSKFNIFK